MRAAGLLLAATIGALACGGTFYALGVVLGLSTAALRPHYGLVVAATTVSGVVGGGWIGVRVFRWLEAPRETDLPS